MDAGKLQEGEARRDREEPSEEDSHVQSARECVCMCVEAEFPLDSLGPDLPGFSSRGSFKPVQPSLAWSVGNAPDFDNGENLGPCAPTCSEACTHLQQYLQTRPASPRHTCAATCTHACLHLVRPTGVNTRMCTSRDCQYPPDTCHPSGTKSQPTGPTQRDMKQTGSPGLHASRRLVSTQVRATHTAAGVTQAPIVLPGTGGQ